MNATSIMRRTIGPDRGRGATLIVGMILLLLMTVAGLTALKSIRTEERMAGNLQDDYLAFQAAEAALREAESLLSDPDLSFPLPTKGRYLHDQNGVPSPADFTTSNAQQYSRSLGAVAQPPRYIMERLAPYVVRGPSLRPQAWGKGYYFRITAVGYGASETTRVVLQATYKR